MLSYRALKLTRANRLFHSPGHTPNVDEVNSHVQSMPSTHVQFPNLSSAARLNIEPKAFNNINGAESTLAAVQRAVRSDFGEQYTVELFGSARTGLATAKSDLDMVILDPSQPHGYLPGKGPRKPPPIYIMPRLARALKARGFTIRLVLGAAAVPIVRFKDPETNLMVDLNVNERLGIANSDLTKRYCELNPRLGPVIVAIKEWAHSLGLNTPGGIGSHPATFSSYALSMMSIAFFQSQGLLPNLQDPSMLPSEPSVYFFKHPKKTVVVPCDIRYGQADGWTAPNDVPVEDLLQRWFKFWSSEFDFEEQAISIRHGGIVSRSAIREEGLLTSPRYLWNIDPFIRTKNLSRSVGPTSLARFQLDCQRRASYA